MRREWAELRDGLRIHLLFDLPDCECRTFQFTQFADCRLSLALPGPRTFSLVSTVPNLQSSPLCSALCQFWKRNFTAPSLERHHPLSPINKQSSRPLRRHWWLQWSWWGVDATGPPGNWAARQMVNQTQTGQCWCWKSSQKESKENKAKNWRNRNWVKDTGIFKEREQFERLKECQFELGKMHHVVGSCYKKKWIQISL